MAAYGENTKNDVENDDVLTSELFIGKSNKLCSLKYDLDTWEAEYEQVNTALPKLFNDNSIFCAHVPSTDTGTCPGKDEFSSIQQIVADWCLSISRFFSKTATFMSNFNN